MVVIYESFRSPTPDNIFSVSVSANPNPVILTGTYYFWAVFRNRVGFSKPTNSKSLTLTGSDRPAIGINDNIIESGEAVYQVVILANTVDNPASAHQVAAINLRQIDRTTLIPLPITLYLDRSEHLNLSPQIAQVTNLPTGVNRLNGQVREITSTGKILEFDSLINDWRERSSLSSYVTDTTNTMGCDRPVELVDARDVLPVPSKNYNSNSIPFRFWWANGLSNDGGSQIEQGSKAQLAFWVNGSRDESNLFSDRVKVKLLGYVDKSTGVLGTNIPQVGREYLWHPQAPLNLPQALPRGTAAVWEIILSFDNDEINLPSLSNLLISITPLSDSGVRSDLWNFTGDCAIDAGNKLLVLPNRRLSGKALIKGYAIDNSNEQYLVNILDDTVQYVAISGSRNGEVAIRTSLNDLLATEALRAVVSTVGGEQFLSDPVSISISGNNYLRIKITAANKIRPDYPDFDLQGKACPLNAPFYNIYLIKNNTNIYKKTVPVAAIVTGELTINITSLADFTSIPNLPVNNDAAFGLFEYGQITLNEISGASLGAGAYQVTVTYFYPSSGNHAITKISHAVSDGCIPKLNLFNNIPAGSFASYEPKVVSANLIINGSYTLTPFDKGKELIFTDDVNIIIPDGNNTTFPPGWHCLVALDGIGIINFYVENVATLIPSGGDGNLSLQNQGTVSIRHRYNNEWKLEGALSP